MNEILSALQQKYAVKNDPPGAEGRLLRTMDKFFQANRNFNRIADREGMRFERRRYYWRGQMLRWSETMGFRGAIPFALKTPSGRAPAVESHRRYKL